MTDTMPGDSLLRSQLRGTKRGRLADPVFKAFITSAGVLILILLATMVVRTTADAWPIFEKEGLGFFVGDQWSAGDSFTNNAEDMTGTYGALPFIYGTVITSAIALVIALPLAIAVALYVTQFAPRRWRSTLSYMVETLAAVPSIVYGLWGLLFFLPTVIRPVMEFLNARLGGSVFLFEGPVFGVSYFACGVVLAIMILPIITAISREVFSASPTDEQHAAFGLGATRWEMIRQVLLPRSFSGLVGASMLGLGRALGETIAAAMLVGGSQKLGRSLLFAGDTLAGHIANTFADAAPETVLGLLAIGVALFILTTLINVAARILVWRVGRTAGDSAV